MLVKDVILKYHKLVPFPWTPTKIKKAGYETGFFLVAMGRELQQCEDIDTPTAKAVLGLLTDLEVAK